MDFLCFFVVQSVLKRQRWVVVELWKGRDKAWSGDSGMLNALDPAVSNKYRSVPKRRRKKKIKTNKNKETKKKSSRNKVGTELKDTES